MISFFSFDKTNSGTNSIIFCFIPISYRNVLWNVCGTFVPLLRVDVTSSDVPHLDIDTYLQTNCISSDLQMPSSPHALWNCVYYMVTS
jgi:hypothetical protein